MDEESTNSSDQEQEISSVDLGVGRSYECIFCKRGFNTAQALGGHMNIHRKDRSRNKPLSASTNHYLDQEQHDHLMSYAAPRLYHQTPSSKGVRRFSPQDHHHPHLAYATTYFPPAPPSANSTLYQSNYGSDGDRLQYQPPSEIPGDWRMRLSLEFAPSMAEDLDKSRRGLDQDEELDLELRLGYDS